MFSVRKRSRPVPFSFIYSDQILYSMFRIFHLSLLYMPVEPELRVLQVEKRLLSCLDFYLCLKPFKVDIKRTFIWMLIWINIYFNYTFWGLCLYVICFNFFLKVGKMKLYKNSKKDLKSIDLWSVEIRLLVAMIL